KRKPPQLAYTPRSAGRTSSGPHAESILPPLASRSGLIGAVPQRPLLGEAIAFAAIDAEIRERVVARVAVDVINHIAHADFEQALQRQASLALRFHPLAIPGAALPVEPARGGAVAEADVPVREQFAAPVARLVTGCPARGHCPARTATQEAAVRSASYGYSGHARYVGLGVRLGNPFLRPYPPNPDE